jgi:(E)-4-hydroxy-3-methylbut-2-enyl-diphosphate synthase
MIYKSRVVAIGNLLVGGSNAVRVQSMTNTNTRMTDATINQSIRLIEAGSELVRITASGIKEAENLASIKKAIRNAGFNTPLIADIHFNHRSAEIAAGIVEKVRINPGNYISNKPLPTSEQLVLQKKRHLLQKDEELELIERNLKPLIRICKDNGTAIRIGVNHGSLGGRIIDRYGDTVEGMVESALEYARIFDRLSFGDLVISVKSSNTRVMADAYMLLATRLLEEGLNFPLHIGVTEAGNGIEGRMKSIAGIGAVLNHGIGDTIRVSLTEAPVNEIGVAKSILQRVGRNAPVGMSETALNTEQHLYSELNETALINEPHVQPHVYSILPVRHDLLIDLIDDELKDDRQQYGGFPQKDNPVGLFLKYGGELYKASPEREITKAEIEPIIMRAPASDVVAAVKSMRMSGDQSPVILQSCVDATSLEELMIENCLHPGTLLLNGIGQGLCIDINKLLNPEIPQPNPGEGLNEKQGADNQQLMSSITKNEEQGTKNKEPGTKNILSNQEQRTKNQEPGTKNTLDSIIEQGYMILQATRARFTKNEYIACPSCGRTHFEIEKRLEEVKAATSHLKGLKIAVMGCIVNGPGEMADADYGYVGAGNGKVTLYKGKQAVIKNIPEGEALQQLLILIGSSL